MTATTADPLLSLTLDEVRQRASRAPLVPVFREIVADTLTPVTAYRALAGDGPGFLLESVEGGERLGRYSFVAGPPVAVITIRPGVAEVDDGQGRRRLEGRDPLDALERYLRAFAAEPVDGLPSRFCGGAVGYLGYEAARYVERLPVPDDDPLGVPDGVFLVADTFVCFDHVLHRLKLVSHVRPGGGSLEARYRAAADRVDALGKKLAQPVRVRSLQAPRGIAPSTAQPTRSRAEFSALVARAQAYIRSGDVYQVQVAQRYHVPVSGDPFDVYRVLRALNPSPYMYFLRLPGLTVLGTSPEILVTVEGGRLRYRPIAGTRRRGRDPESDHRMEVELRQSEKERAEHIMLVDLGRNDLGRVSVIGSVQVTELMQVERYSHVMHLISNITGVLRPDCTAMDALRSCFPAGTVTGAPKVRAMEIIAELEDERRGVYAGAIGYLSFTGNLDTCIAIRTMVVKDGVATVQAAAGIVVDSNPDEEFLETENKAAALLQALEAVR
ncbi:MAG: anthranilate synthase component I [Candidatus Dormibacteraeota bacterium]|nr:anthranilate synthase component I [Candidatus Dormibacteraeota bacterium]